jgi:hypothetical protein
MIRSAGFFRRKACPEEIIQFICVLEVDAECESLEKVLHLIRAL